MVRVLGWLLVVSFIFGCTPRQDMRVKDNSTDKTKAAVLRMYQHDLDVTAEQAYKEGVKQGAAAAKEMNGPYVWRPYKIETITVPGRVVNGIMYPSHQEEIIVRPTSIDRVYGDTRDEQ